MLMVVVVVDVRVKFTRVVPNLEGTHRLNHNLMSSKIVLFNDFLEGSNALKITSSVWLV